MDTSFEAKYYIDIFQKDLEKILEARKTYKVDDKFIFSQLRIVHVVEYCDDSPESSTYDLSLRIFGEDEHCHEVDEVIILNGSND